MLLLLMLEAHADRPLTMLMPYGLDTLVPLTGKAYMLSSTHCGTHFGTHANFIMYMFLRVVGGSHGWFYYTSSHSKGRVRHPRWHSRGPSTAVGYH